MRSSKEIINILKEKRESLNISQRELAKLTGINNSTISRYEKYQREFPINDLPIFCKALHLNIDEVLDVKPPKAERTEPKYITSFSNASISVPLIGTIASPPYKFKSAQTVSKYYSLAVFVLYNFL